MMAGPTADGNRSRRRPRFRWFAVGAVVAFGVLLAVSLFGPHAINPGGPELSPCLCTGFALGAPTPGMNGSAHDYSMSVTPSADATVGDLRFWVSNSNRVNETVPGATVQILGESECLIATFSIDQQSWSPGPVSAANHCDPPGTTATVLTSGMTLVLTTGTTSLVGQGDELVTTLSSGGSITAALP